MPRRKWNQIPFVKHQNSEPDIHSDDLKSDNYNVKDTESNATESSKYGKTLFNMFDYIVLTTIALSITIYLLTNIECISWQLSSIGRIFLIKILPYYDWRPLKNKQCLIDSFTKKWDMVNDNLNCDICENIKHIEVYDTLDENILEERYIKLDMPVILTKGLKTWPSDSKFIQELSLNEHFSSSYPCKLSTNILKDLGTTGQLLRRVDYFDEFFLHFQNCDLNAMKILRRYTFRPDLLPPIYSPVLYNWLMWNENYNTTYYKKVDLVEKVMVFGQLFGSTHISLIPRKNCANVCPNLNIELSGREMLIFTNFWDLEYRPFEKGENMAVILETSD